MAAGDNFSPLTEAHFQQIVDGMAAADVGLRQVELAKRAGIDVTQAESDLRAARDKLAQIRQVYFPGR